MPILILFSTAPLPSPLLRSPSLQSFFSTAPLGPSTGLPLLPTRHGSSWHGGLAARGEGPRRPPWCGGLGRTARGLVGLPGAAAWSARQGACSASLARRPGGARRGASLTFLAWRPEARVRGLLGLLGAAAAEWEPPWWRGTRQGTAREARL